ncbi:MAG TPA: hypothetical protein VIP11_19280 [Gemmatimonadaceae bacterium]
MPYCYFVVTPDFGDDGRARYCMLNTQQQCIFCKFGITSDANLDTTRRGYTTHNPSHRFIKIKYNANIEGVSVSIGRFPNVKTITCTADLGKVLQIVLGETGMTQVGNTEWMSTSNVDTAMAYFNYLLKFENTEITKDSVGALITNIFKK